MKVFLIDGTFELYRAHFSSPEATNREGLEVGATKGFLRSMWSLLKDGEVTHLACAFDHVIESFRNELFDGYKTGEGIEPELWSQFPLVEEASRALGIATWPMVEFEADDAIAAAAVRCGKSDRVEQVIVATPDKDLAQVVSGDRIIQWDRIRKTFRNEDGVKEKFGVSPASIPDYLALVGDTADGIPGVPRWGAKSSSTVLAHYETIEAIPKDVDSWAVKVRGAKGLSATLEAQREDAMLYKKLATLRLDVPLELSPNALKWNGIDKDRLEALCHQLDDQRFFERIVSV